MRDLLLQFFSKLRVGLFGSRTVQLIDELFTVEAVGRVWFCRFRPILVRNRGWFRSEEKIAGHVTAVSMFAFWLPAVVSADKGYLPETADILSLALSQPLQTFYVVTPGEPVLHWRAVHILSDAAAEACVRDFWRTLVRQVGAYPEKNLAPLFEHERQFVTRIVREKWSPHPTLENVRD